MPSRIIDQKNRLFYFLTTERKKENLMANMCATGTGGGGAPKEFMLFGVRVVIDSMRKSVSLNNLSQYESSGSNNNNDNNKDDLVASGYASADDAVHRASRSRSERRRGLIGF